MSFYQSVKNYIKENSLIHPGDSIVVGLSGGADSVALLSVLVKLREEMNLTLTAVHVNHMIRGEEAEGDAAFVRELCDKYQVKLKTFTKDIPAMAEEKKLTEEEAGRIYRYEAFEYVREKEEGDAIAVAHHRDDLVETAIFNMIRGTSLRGVAGIQPKRGYLIRPFLDVWKSEIEDYIREEGLEYRVDSTNLDVDYSRNRIRQIIIPEMEKLNQGAKAHIAEMARDVDSIVKEAEADMMDFPVEFTWEESESLQAGSEEENRLAKKAVIPVYAVRSIGSFAKGEVVLHAMEKVCGRRKDLTREHVKSVLNLMNLKSGSRVSLPYGMVARLSYDYIVIEKSNIRIYRKSDSDLVESSRTEENPGEEEKSFDGDKSSSRKGGEEKTFDGDKSSSRKGGEQKPSDREMEGEFSTEIVDRSSIQEISKKDFTKMVDCDKIKDTFLLRTPMEGDFIVIDDKGGTKKLSKLFTDMKVDQEERKTWPVVADGSEIIWAVGLRLSERYKITDETGKVLVMTYEKE